MTDCNPFFIHWKGWPTLSPFGDYLVEFGIREFMPIAHRYHPVHHHEGIEFHYVMKGSYQWRIDNQVFHLYPGDALVNCPWQGHGSATTRMQRGSFGWLILKPASFTPQGTLDLGPWSRLSSETQQSIGRLIVGDVNPIAAGKSEMERIFHNLNRELVRKDFGYRERVNMLLDYLFVDVARMISRNRKSCRKRDDDFLRRLNERMNECMVHRMNMDEMAYSFGMCASTFNKKVKELTGFSSADYLLGLKIDKAGELLLTTQKRITEISAECGFYSSQHFAKIFQKRMGMTPSAYRKQGRGH